MRAFTIWGLLICLGVLSCKAEGERVSDSSSSSAPGVHQPTDDETALCEHGVPNGTCPKCNPALENVYRAQKNWCEEHGMPESFCPICHPDRAAPVLDQDGETLSMEARIVRLRRTDMEETAGIQTVAARESSATTSISCNVRLAFNEDKMADVRAFVPGVVRTVGVRVGALVQKGDPLFELDSVHVSDLHAERIAARERVRVATTQVQRMRELQKTDVVSARSLETAEEALTQATSMLAGIEAALKTLGATSRGSVVLRAPIMGEVVERQAIQGVLANQDDSLAKIVDVSSLWAFCDVSESHVHGLAVGQSLNIELEGIQPIVGELDWISPQIDPISRTILTRAVVPNEGRELRANQFGRAQILGAAGAGVEVPRSAIQRVESQDVIFVRDEPAVFSPRIVTQHSEGEWVRVTGRIKAGEPVVTQGAVFLRTEIMPGSIGAGCCEITPGGK